MDLDSVVVVRGLPSVPESKRTMMVSVLSHLLFRRVAKVVSVYLPMEDTRRSRRRKSKTCVPPSSFLPPTLRI